MAIVAAQQREITYQILRDVDLRADLVFRAKATGDLELLQQVERLQELAATRAAAELGGAGLDAGEEEPSRDAAQDPFKSENPEIEAIIRRIGRPVVTIHNDDIVVAGLESDTWRARLQQHRDALKSAIHSVGRVEVDNNPHWRWAGTAWVVAEDVIITARQVAEEFGQERDSRFVFRSSFLGEMGARLDFRQEHQGGEAAEFRLVEILHIEEDDGPDLALLRIDWAGQEPRAPIPLAASPDVGMLVAVVGYPAKDSRTNIPEVMERIFGNVYHVKRLAPGQIIQLNKSGDHFAHDCTTSGGGCGGAVVCDLATGEAVGLHFAGREDVGNYAVSAPKIKERLDAVLGAGWAGD
jgi:endonuclease G